MTIRSVIGHRTLLYLYGFRWGCPSKLYFKLTASPPPKGGRGGGAFGGEQQQVIATRRLRRTTELCSGPLGGGAGPNEKRPYMTRFRAQNLAAQGRVLGGDYHTNNRLTRRSSGGSSARSAGGGKGQRLQNMTKDQFVIAPNLSLFSLSAVSGGVKIRTHLAPPRVTPNSRPRRHR